MLNLRVN